MAFGIILGTTRVVTLGDTPVYANDIVTHLGKSPFGHGNSLWEFGHLLWRPLGWALTSAASPLLSRATDWTPYMQAIFILMAISLLSSVVTVILWYRLVAEVTGAPKTAYLVVLAMSCSNGFLIYVHSGCSYLPGLMCLTASLYLLYKERIGEAAVCYSLSALLWLPFILAGPALLLIAIWPGRWDAPLSAILRSIKPAAAIRFIAISAGCIVVVFGLALGAREISSVKEAEDWYSEANHGWSQSIRIVRIATGLPRSALSLGGDGILYKRYLLRDPYARVTVPDLIRASLWKIAAFDLFVICLLHELLRHQRSRWPLLVVLVGAGPVIFFAVFLFEPGSPERYLPALPFLVLAVGWILRDFTRRFRAHQIAVAGFLLCLVVNNGYSFAAPRMSNEDEDTRVRIAGLRARLNGGGMAVILNYQDKIEDLVNRSPFDALNRPQPFPLYAVIEPATLRVLHWRQEFAAEASAAWSRGGEIWISRRFWSERPRPEWNWVEGDDQRLAWPELPRFFSVLQTDADLGGEDGFLRLARNGANQAFLAPLAALYHPPAPRNAAQQ